MGVQSTEVGGANRTGTGGEGGIEDRLEKVIGLLGELVEVGKDLTSAVRDLGEAGRRLAGLLPSRSRDPDWHTSRATATGSVDGAASYEAGPEPEGWQ